MPTYSYQCKRCSHTQDIFHGMNAKPVVICSECAGPCMKLLGTGSGIIFKGSGFYETDYKKKGKAPSGETSPASSKSDAKPSSEKSGKDTPKSDTKTSTATKAE